MVPGNVCFYVATAWGSAKGNSWRRVTGHMPAQKGERHARFPSVPLQARCEEESPNMAGYAVDSSRNPAGRSCMRHKVTSHKCLLGSTWCVFGPTATGCSSLQIQASGEVRVQVAPATAVEVAYLLDDGYRRCNGSLWLTMYDPLLARML